ncbi:MAG: macro domain-containing protein, partial [Gemmataceae bacterium]|nr:macro domain-containing protein [Gemmataceae bacterium]
MTVTILTGDVLDVPADVLIASANPWLQMTGGVNLAILLRPKGEDVHAELQRYLPATKPRIVPPGTVVRTGPGAIPVKHILHAVAIDPSYDSSVELVATTTTTALTQARDLGAKVVTLPALATGFGPLTVEDFAAALKQVLTADWRPLEELKVVLKDESA